MNYRHLYHAGNFADIFKHSILLLLLSHLCRKETPFRVIDSHAGRGIYDLFSPEAQKTGEAASGIGLIKEISNNKLPAGLIELVKLIGEFNRHNWPEIRYYPGSPYLARHFLRDNDRLVLAELHPSEAWALRREFRKDKKTLIMQDDGYAIIKAQLPPPERRGLILIDPPFEKDNEFSMIIEALKEGIKRWQTGIYVIWYPIKDANLSNVFLGNLTKLGMNACAVEFMLQPPDDTSRLNGCGMAVINPPWQFEEKVTALIPVLQEITGAKGNSGLRWLGRWLPVPE